MVWELFCEMFGEERTEPRSWNATALEGGEAVNLVAGSAPCGPQHTGGCCSNRVVSLAAQRYITG